MRDPTLPAPPAEIDWDCARKVRREECDRSASNVRLARVLLREVWSEGSPADKRTTHVGELFSSGAFSIVEANEALDQIEWEDARS